MAASIDRPVPGPKTREVRPRLRRNSFPHKQANKEVGANLDTILELMLTRLAILPPFEAGLATKAAHSLPTRMQVSIPAWVISSSARNPRLSPANPLNFIGYRL